MSNAYGGYRSLASRDAMLSFPPTSTTPAMAANYSESPMKATAKKFARGVTSDVLDAAALSSSLTALHTAGLKPSDFSGRAGGKGGSKEISMLPMEKPTAKHSSYRTSFPDFTEEYRMLEDLTPVTLDAAFASVDAEGSGMVHVSELRRLFHAATGLPPTDHQWKVLSAAAAGYHGGRFDGAAWRDIVATTVDHLKRDLYACMPAATKDSVMTASRYREAQDQRRRLGLTDAAAAAATTASPAGFHVRGPQSKSSYQVDIGAAIDDVPATRPVTDPVGAGLWSTTRDLAAGTSRQSKHAPGYMGHIPSFTGTHAASQGLGQTKRDTFHSKTNLADTYTRRVPGYGGHVPKFSSSTAADVAMPVGPHAATDAAAASHVVLTHWAAKRAGPA